MRHSLQILAALALSLGIGAGCAADEPKAADLLSAAEKTAGGIKDGYARDQILSRIAIQWAGKRNDDEALRVWTTLSAGQEPESALRRIAAIQARRGDLSLSRKTVLSGLQHLSKTDPQSVLPAAETFLADALCDAGQEAEAAAVLRRAGLPLTAASCAGLGNGDEAAKTLMREDPSPSEYTLDGIGMHFVDKGRYSQLAVFCRRACGGNAPQMLCRLATRLALAGRFDEAQRVCQAVADPDWEPPLRRFIGNLQQERRRAASAPRDLDIPRLLGGPGGSAVDNARRYLLCAKTEQARGHREAALALLAKARQTAESIKPAESINASKVGFTATGTLLRLLCQVACAEARSGRLDDALELLDELGRHTLISVHEIQAAVYVGGALAHSTGPSPAAYPSFPNAAPVIRAALLVGAAGGEDYDVDRDEGEIDNAFTMFAQTGMAVARLPKLQKMSPARRACVAWIDKSCAPAVACPLMASLLADDPDPGIRQMAAAALGSYRDGSRDVADALAKVLDDADAAVAIAAAESLQNLDRAGSPVVQKMTEHLGNKDVEVRVRAVEVLGRCRSLPAETVQRLLLLAEESDSRVRLYAARALLAAGDRDGLGARCLAQLAKDRDPWVAAKAIETMARLPDLPPEGRNAVRAAIAHEDDYVTLFAAEAMLKIAGRSPEVEEALLRVKKARRSEFIALTAAGLLGELARD
jgi:hypothetical protein